MMRPEIRKFRSASLAIVIGIRFVAGFDVDELEALLYVYKRKYQEWLKTDHVDVKNATTWRRQVHQVKRRNARRYAALCRGDTGKVLDDGHRPVAAIFVCIIIYLRGFRVGKNSISVTSLMALQLQCTNKNTFTCKHDSICTMVSQKTIFDD